MKLFSTREKGFTLVEILIVVTVLAILIAIVTASFRESTLKSKNSRIATDIAEVRKIAEAVNLRSIDGYTGLCYNGHLSQLDPDLGILEQNIQDLGGSTVCYSGPASYCVHAVLAGGKGYLCIDDEAHFSQTSNPVCVDEDSICP